jgi:acetyl esterase/lipase
MSAMMPNLTPELIEAFKDTIAALPGPELSDAIERIDYVVSENPHVVIRVHRRKDLSGPAPCVFSMHGGGYVLGSYTMDDFRFDGWCQHLDLVGVSVEYRLAPDTTYPGPLEDCYAGLEWVYDNAAKIGVDPNLIGVTGISAGGGLAAALAIYARDKGKVPLKFQLLECPMVDDTQSTDSSKQKDLMVWTHEANTYGWRSYLGELYGTDDIPGTAAPARQLDLSNLPPALVIAGGADGFRDEDIEYARRLNDAGVPTDLHVIAGAPHGVIGFVGSEVANRWARYVNEWLTRTLATLTSSPTD